jgi:hypothetical protein
LKPDTTLGSRGLKGKNEEGRGEVRLEFSNFYVVNIFLRRKRQGNERIWK